MTDSTDTTTSGFPPDREPERIGPYRILERIGEGGMGVVFLAEQEAPLRRRVALKVIKPGMDSRQVLARFDAERQALALMNHQGVARVFDAGSTPEGRPYFVMEHVQGVPITEFCDRNRLDTVTRLELFAQVCEAIQHAHQKGIIHRDIKPSNVLVGLVDGRPSAKVIDFGVAKATQSHLTEQTLYTQQGVVLGTPEYMSPEQADLSAVDIDTRSDVYSLGVLLYELLAGVLPFDSEVLRRAALHEMQRMIRETDPPRPSTRVQTLGDAARGIAECRKTDVRSLHRQLRGELDWIVMRSMEKDRGLRYVSPLEVAADIRRHLRSEPVLAGPPSAGYRARRFVRRHRVGVGAVVGVAVALLGVTIITSQQVRMVQRERSARREAVLASTLKAKGTAEFISNLIVFVEPQDLGVALWNTLGSHLADAHRREGASEQDIARVLATFEELFRGIDRSAVAIQLVDEHVFAPAGRRLKAEMEKTIYEPELRTILGHFDLGGGLYIAASHNLLLGDYPKAEQFARRSVLMVEQTLGREHPRVAVSLDVLAGCQVGQGHFADAESLYKRSLDIRMKTVGAAHASVGNSLYGLATLYYQQGRYEEAEPVFRRWLVIREKPGGSSIDHVSGLQTFSALLRKAARTKEAQELESRARTIEAVWAKRRAE